MTVSTEITRLKTSIANAYDALEAKGATMPAIENPGNLANTVESITGGGGGSTVTAINKTGAAISQGDKVWINNGSQVADSRLEVNQVVSGSVIGPVIDPSGTFGWSASVKYSLTADTITKLGETPAGMNAGKVVYGAGNSMFLHGDTGAQRCDSINQYSLGDFSNLITNGSYMLIGNGNGTLKKIDLNTGEVLKTYSKTASNSGWYVSFGNIVYHIGVGGSEAKKWTIDDETLSVTETSIPFDNGPAMYPIGVTADGKYIICGRNTQLTFSTTSFVRIVERISEDHLKSLPENEIPADLQPYFGAKKGFISFNPNNGILAVVVSPTDYVVMQYKNGSWHKLNIDLGYPENATEVTCGVSFSNDMNRCSIGYKSTTTGVTTQARFVNLTTVTGYVAVPYKPFNINAETVTGVAKNGASVDDLFEASLSGDTSDVVLAINNLGLETVPSGTKVMLNKDISVIGDLEANLYSYTWNFYCFGNNYLICSGIYRINSDLTLTKLTQTSITSSICGTVTKYKHFYRWDTGKEFVVFDTVKNLLYTYTKETRSWQNSPYYARCYSSGNGIFSFGKFDDDGNSIGILTYTISGVTSSTAPIFYWNNILWIYATRDYSYPTFYAYNINEEEKTATLLTSFASPYSIGNNQYNYIFQVSDNSFLRTIDGVLFKFTAQEDGTLLKSYVDDKGYALDIENKANNGNSNQVYNPDNQTFTIIKDKILHILKYNVDNNSLDEISTVDLSSVYTKITGKYPSYATSIYYSAITSNNNYLNLSYNSRTTSGGYKTSIVSLKNSLGDWKADTNSVINIGANTLTGYTTGNMVDDKLEISTTLPPKINVQLTTPANNAQIAINGSEK